MKLAPERFANLVSAGAAQHPQINTGRGMGVCLWVKSLDFTSPISPAVLGVEVLPGSCSEVSSSPTVTCPVSPAYAQEKGS